MCQAITPQSVPRIVCFRELRLVNDIRVNKEFRKK